MMCPSHEKVERSNSKPLPALHSDHLPASPAHRSSLRAMWNFMGDKRIVLENHLSCTEPSQAPASSSNSISIRYRDRKIIFRICIERMPPPVGTSGKSKLDWRRHGKNGQYSETADPDRIPGAHYPTINLSIPIHQMHIQHQGKACQLSRQYISWAGRRWSVLS